MMQDFDKGLLGLAKMGNIRNILVLFIVNFEHIPHLFLVFLSLSLNN